MLNTALKTGATRWFALAILLIVLDQITKQWIEHIFHFGDVLPVFPGFNLILTYNKGAAFSFLADAGGWQRHFFTVLALVVAVVISFLLRKHHAERLFAAALACILGGAVGNVIDRIIYGHVIDFIQVYYQTYYWPAFNVADSAICIGAGLMVLDSFKKPATKTV